jgi:hypothetical protein
MDSNDSTNIMPMRFYVRLGAIIGDKLHPEQCEVLMNLLGWSYDFVVLRDRFGLLNASNPLASTGLLIKTRFLRESSFFLVFLSLEIQKFCRKLKFGAKVDFGEKSW